MAHRTVPAGDFWIMQYDRMHRSRKRMAGTFSSTEEYDDAVFHFFQDAWHLKDWLKKGFHAADYCAFERRSRCRTATFLCGAADIANGSKHLELDTSRAGTVITERRVNLYIEEDPVRAEHEHSIKGERQHDRC
jgi:hypothetical protein